MSNACSSFRWRQDRGIFARRVERGAGQRAAAVPRRRRRTRRNVVDLPRPAAGRRRPPTQNPLPPRPRPRHPPPRSVEPDMHLVGFIRLLFNRTFTGFTEFYWVLLSFTGFYWILLGFTGYLRFLLFLPFIF